MLAAVVLAAVLPGCVTGHLLAAGRRREYVREMSPVADEAGARVLSYTAEVTDDAGRSCGTVVRRLRLAPAEPVPAPRSLTRIHTAAWVYPLIPLGLAADCVMVPILTLLSPAVLVVGD